MNPKRKAKSEMFELFKQVCNENPAIVSELAAFQTTGNKSEQLINRISETAKFRIPPLTDITAGKSADHKMSNNSPLKVATNTVVKLGITTKTRSNGEYHFKPIDHGEFTVKATATGFQDFEKDEVKIKMGEANRLNVELVSN
jgi:hypothetical protein